jgi:hypothetical protein
MITNLIYLIIGIVIGIIFKPKLIVLFNDFIIKSLKKYIMSKEVENIKIVEENKEEDTN